MIIKPNGNSGQGVDLTTKPQIWFNGKWSGWYLEIYDGVPYWEALISESGTLTAAHGYTCDAWGIGGGGAGSEAYFSGYNYGFGGASGYTNMMEELTIPVGGTAVTIGAGGTTRSAAGGVTKFLALTCNGGNGAITVSSGSQYTNPATTPVASGGSNGSNTGAGGSNGLPGAGKIMSKFWSEPHNTEYGAGGVKDDLDNAGGGGGYLPIGGTNATSGQGYGGGGGGAYQDGSGYLDKQMADWRGKSGCLIIRIKAA